MRLFVLPSLPAGRPPAPGTAGHGESSRIPLRSGQRTIRGDRRERGVLSHANERDASVRPLEFGSTGFYPAFTGAERARRSEELGFDFQMFSENHTRVPDCLGEMRDAIGSTERIKLLCGPLNFVTRNPGVIASGIMPIQILSGGRALCGVASGDSAVAAVGQHPQRIKELERDLGILRSYLHREDVTFGGRHEPARVGFGPRVRSGAHPDGL